jgi:hypothetical protein
VEEVVNDGLSSLAVNVLMSVILIAQVLWFDRHEWPKLSDETHAWMVASATVVFGMSTLWCFVAITSPGLAIAIGFSAGGIYMRMRFPRD